MFSLKANDLILDSLQIQEGGKKTFVEIHLFPKIHAFRFLEKTELVLMIQLMGYSPINGYIKSVYLCRNCVIWGYFNIGSSLNDFILLIFDHLLLFIFSSNKTKMTLLWMSSV